MKYPGRRGKQALLGDSAVHPVSDPEVLDR